MHSEKVKYRKIIEPDMNKIECGYVNWSILVRETYYTGHEYNFV